MLQLLEGPAAVQVRLDKIASATARLGLDRHCALGTRIPSEPGTVLIVEALDHPTDEGVLARVAGKVHELARSFPLYASRLMQS
jgi:hypothetical protein